MWQTQYHQGHSEFAQVWKIFLNITTQVGNNQSHNFKQLLTFLFIYLWLDIADILQQIIVTPSYEFSNFITAIAGQSLAKACK